jgi:hypothetical protein
MGTNPLTPKQGEDGATSQGSVRIDVSSPKHPNVFAVIDAEDLDRVSAYHWSVRRYRKSKTMYAIRQFFCGGLLKEERLHRFIMSAPKTQQVDHRDGNGLNCTKANLRVCTKFQNARNRAKTERLTTSEYKGVWVCKGRYRASICFDGKRLNLGQFSNPIEAAKSYDKAAIRFHGDFARTNFPREEYACG